MIPVQVKDLMNPSVVTIEPTSSAALPLSAAQIAVEEAAVMVILGLPLLRLLPRSRAFTHALARVQ